MSTKHTPGPWKVISGAIVHSSDSAPVAEMNRTEEASKAGIYPVERDANAHLIAAAPELLKACKRLLAGYSLIDEQREEAKEYARQIIAKAEGG